MNYRKLAEKSIETLEQQHILTNVIDVFERKPSVDYMQNALNLSLDNPDWCGIFPGYALLLSGVPLNICRTVVISTYRLAVEHSNPGWTSVKLTGSKFYVPKGEIKPANIVCLATRQNAPRWGNHIAIVLAKIGNHIVTIEGNTTGCLIGSAGRWAIKVHNLGRVVRAIDFTGFLQA